MKPNRLFDIGVVEFAAKPKPVGLSRASGRLTLVLWAICLVMILVMPVYAADGDLDPTFITGPGPFAGVQIIPEIRGQVAYVNGTTDGKDWPYNGCSLLYGTFYGVKVGNIYPPNYGANSCIARLKADSTLDAGFNVNGLTNGQINGEIRAVYIYPHDDPNFPDKILIGGSFNASSGSSGGPSQYNNFARLNFDGTIDTTFPQTQWGGAVTSFGVQGSGTAAKILVGGYSLRVGDMDNGFIYQLIRLNYDGSLDPNYTHWGAPGGYISSIKIHSATDPFPNDVRIFCSYPKNDGSGGTYYMLLLDSNAAPPTITAPVASIGSEAVDGPIFNMAQQSDGKWVIVGAFRNAYDSLSKTWFTRHRVARFNVDRSLDIGYDVGTGGPNGNVNQVSPMSTTDDRMVLTGNFDAWNGTPCGYIMRLTTTGGVDPSFTPGSGAGNRIMRLNWNSDGSGGMIYGYLRYYNGLPRGGIAGLNADGSLNDSFANVTAMAGWAGTVYSLAMQSDGKILIGGNFNGVGGKNRNGIARLNPDGSLDNSFKGGVDGMVRSVAVQADGKILLGGDFGQCQGYACTSLARLNPDSSLDTTFKPAVVNGTSAMSWLKQVVPLANGQMMIAGDFYSPNGGYPVARLNSDGTKDPGFALRSSAHPRDRLVRLPSTGGGGR